VIEVAVEVEAEEDSRVEEEEEVAEVDLVIEVAVVEVEEDFREMIEILIKDLQLKLLKWEFTSMPVKVILSANQRMKKCLILMLLFTYKTRPKSEKLTKFWDQSMKCILR